MGAENRVNPNFFWYVLHKGYILAGFNASRDAHSYALNAPYKGGLEVISRSDLAGQYELVSGRYTRISASNTGDTKNGTF